MRALIIPKNGTNHEIHSESSFVLIGANGSGKSRLGAWIEFGPQGGYGVHRVSAQRSNTLPERTSPTSTNAARNQLLYGHADDNQRGQKRLRRWGQKPATQPLSDYDKLLNFLFAEEFNVATKFRQEAYDRQVAQEALPVVPQTKIDTLKSIWTDVLPHREIEFRGGIVTAMGGGAGYNGSEMSDGERVVLYLIGQVLCAPPNNLVVIDEPEIHIHSSIQARLWESLERQRDDCTFVYLTHDLDFAARKSDSTRVWIKSFDGQIWDWDLIPGDTGIPDRLLLEILGSRKDVLFVEGDRGSIDTAVYSVCLPSLSICPVGSCLTVIERTKSFRDLAEFHHIQAYGLIDRDHREGAEVDDLKKRGVFCLEVAEAENLFLQESVFREVAALMELDDSSVEAAKTCVFGEFQRNRDAYATRHVAHRVCQILGGFDGSAKEEAELTGKLDALVAGIDVPTWHRNSRTCADDIIADRRYSDAIRLFDHKGLVRIVGRHFEIKPTGYVEFVLRKAQSSSGAGMINAIAQGIPGDLRELPPPPRPRPRSA